MNNLEHQLSRQRTTARNFFWHRLRWDALHKRLPSVQDPLKIVDVGAGSGIFSDLVSSRLPNAEYFFVEPSHHLASVLEEHHGKEHNLTQAAHYKGIHRVLLLDVLEHIEDDKKFLRDLAEKMESGAVLAITVPAHKYLWSRWDEMVGHVRRYDRKSLEAVFETVNDKFEILSNEYVFWELTPLALYRKIKLAFRPAKDAMSESEVPELPSWINELFFIYGKIGLLLNQWIPFGTSVALVARRK